MSSWRAAKQLPSGLSFGSSWREDAKEDELASSIILPDIDEIDDISMRLFNSSWRTSGSATTRYFSAEKLLP